MRYFLIWDLADPRHTFTTRLIFAAMSSKSYSRDTLDSLHKGMAEDLNKLFCSGVSMRVGDNSICVRAAVVGGKGDWAYVRKAYGLRSGYNVPGRICHMCMVKAPHLIFTVISKFLTPLRVHNIFPIVFWGREQKGLVECWTVKSSSRMATSRGIMPFQEARRETPSERIWFGFP